MPYATTSDSVAISYDDLGTGVPALLFTTGWCSSKGRWAKVAQLAARHRRVLNMEWRGHGASDAAPHDFGLEEMVEDALAVVDAAGVDEFVPCSASHSGFVAIELRRRFPERVRALVHVDWYVIPPPPPYRAVLEQLVSPDEWPQARDALYRIWRAGVDRPDIDASFDVMSRQDADMWMRSGREIMAGYERVGSPMEAWTTFEPSIPVLHVYGQPQDAAFLEAQERFAAEHPWFRVRKLPGQTHFAMVETPELVANAIEELVATL